MQTFLGPPVFGTRYIVTTSHDGSCAILMGNNTFNSSPEVHRYIQWCLERSIVNEIQNDNHDDGSRGRVGGEKGGWRQVSMGNEMSKEKDDTGLYKRLRVEIEEGMLAVRWTAESGKQEGYEWAGMGGTKEGKKVKTIYEVLQDI